jgi:hypothetical protein
VLDRGGAASSRLTPTAAGSYKRRLPTLFLGELLWRKTGHRRGASAPPRARMMVEGHKMDLPTDLHGRSRGIPRRHGALLERRGQAPVRRRRAESVDECARGRRRACTPAERRHVHYRARGL